MAKIIKLTPEYKEQILKEFGEALSNAKFSDGKLSYTKVFNSVQRKATVYFTELAWMKMQTLVREFDKEIAWHGVAYRGADPEKDEYTITDILVYPQEVTGSTVTTDQSKYQMWLYSHDDDVFNNIRMQGHSHVNFSTSPSGVDTSLYESILDQLDDSMFYIFLIYNKKGDKTYLIYDMAKNILFETADVTVKVIDDGTGMNAFLEDAKSKVTTHVTQTQNYGSYGGYGGGYGSHYGNGSYYNSGNTKPAAASSPAKTGSVNATASTAHSSGSGIITSPAKREPAADSKKKDTGSGNTGKKSGLRRKGKRKDGNKKSSIKSLPSSHYDEEDYGGFDDDDSYFRGYGYRGGGIY